MRRPYCGSVGTRSRPRHPFLDWPGPLAFAHRGGAGEAPENTLPAFRRAVELGYRYLETDVHRTSDGVVVAFHDDDLSRTCGRPGRIHELPWAEVATARVDGREPIPRLEELLEEFPDARINIDAKTDRVVQELGDLLERTSSLPRVCVGSFSDKRIRQLRRRFGPAICTSAGRIEIALLVVFGRAPAQLLAAQVPSRLYGLPIVSKRLIRNCHQRGIEVHVWTIDEADEMDRLLDLGVDGI